MNTVTRRHDPQSLTRRAVLGTPLVLGAMSALAQQPAQVIGFLSSRSPDESKAHTAAFLRGLAEGGFSQAQIEYRWARGDYDKLRAMARELATGPISLLVAGGDPAALAAHSVQEKTTVFLVGADPVRLGLVRTLNRPEGNATGVSLVTSALGAKRAEFLSEMVPTGRGFSLLRNPNNPDVEAHTAEVRAACRALGRALQTSDVTRDVELDPLLAAMAHSGGLIVQNDPFFDSHRQELVSLCARYRLPAIFHAREYPEIGGLMSYGPSLTTGYHQLGLQAARVLGGQSPRDLPVVQSSHFELVISLKTAQALGLELRPSIMSRADEIVE